MLPELNGVGYTFQFPYLMIEKKFCGFILTLYTVKVVRNELYLCFTQFKDSFTDVYQLLIIKTKNSTVLQSLV